MAVGKERSMILADCGRKIDEWMSQRKHGDKSNAPQKKQYLAEVMLAIISLKKSEYELLINGITGEESTNLLSIVSSSANEARRDASPEMLPLGLFALIVENLTDDYRESIMMLALLDDAVRKTGVRLEDIYEPLKQYASPKTADLIEGYFREGERTIESMGYIETTDKYGNFRYKRNW